TALSVGVAEDEGRARAGAAVLEFGVHSHRGKQQLLCYGVDFHGAHACATARWFKRSIAATAARCASSASASLPIMVNRPKEPKALTSTKVMCAAFSASL